jgi:glycosyltransferase involved in cell wall biosynthesis
MLLLLALALVSVLGMRRRYAAVDVYNSTDLAVFTAVVPKLRGARVVLNMLEMNPELAAARLRLGPAHPLIRLLRVCERLAVAWSDRVITVSAPCCDILTRRGVAQDRVLVVPNTQPSDSYSGSRGERVEPLLVAHGVQIERYGLQVAIRALAVLVPRWPNLALELIGDGEYQPELRRLAGELGIGGHVRFVGSLYWGEALQRVSKASIGLVTVLDDGYGHLVLPTRLLEYAALRIPAACSRLPAIERYFPEDAVAYVEPGNAVELASRIDALLSNPPLGRKQADRAAAALRSISWDAVSSRYLAALGLGGGVAVSHAA